MFVRFSWEAYNYIYSYTCIGHLFTDFGNSILVEFPKVAALHLFENIIATTLQRNMEVRDKGSTLCHKSDSLILEQVRFNRGDAQALYTLHCI